MMRLLAVLLVGIQALHGAALAQDAQTTAHEQVRRSLLHLTASGQIQDQREPIVTQGTGFFVSDQGYALTTAHLLNEQKRKGAINIVLQARIADSGAAPLPAAVISTLPDLDLMLLRVLIPVGQPGAVPLEIGSADTLRQGEMPMLLTSGFFNALYRKQKAEVNDTTGSTVPYAWNLNVETNGGQSGGPVYYLDGSNVRVIGLLKSTAGGTNTFAQMIPIDYAMPLIGHLRMDRLEAEVFRLREEVAQLRIRLGDSAPNDPPLIPRVQRMEPIVSEVRQHVSWQPEVEEDGALTIIGRRLVRDSEVPPQVNYVVTPTVTYGPVTATRTPMDDELGIPRVASDQLTLTYTRGDFDQMLRQHIQRKLGIRPGEKFTINSLEFAISLPATGADAAEKTKIKQNREVTAQ